VKFQASRMSLPFVSFVDQAMHLAHAAGGQQATIQLLWRYHRPVDHNALHQFRNHLAHGLLARLIQPAILPFGRHHWVSAPQEDIALEVPEVPLATEMLHTWANAQIELPLDPSQGPGWTFTVQPLCDGSTLVSLVVSHCIADGGATAIAVRQAALGERQAPAYPARATHHPGASLAHELLRLAKDTPAALRALAQLAHTVRRKASKPSARTVSTTANEQTIVFPSVFLRVPAAVWNAKAAELGAKRLTLVAAMTAAFAVALGRIRDDHVTLMIPVNHRSVPSDTDANCVSIATLKVPAREPYGDLQSFQHRLLSTLRQARGMPDPLTPLLPLVPWIPKRAFKAASQLALDALTYLPVTCSHMGDFPTEVLRIDGAPSDRFCFRGVDRQVTVRDIEARQGVGTLITGSMPGFILLNFTAYQPGGVTQTTQLRLLVEQLMAIYGITGDFFDA